MVTAAAAAPIRRWMNPRNIGLLTQSSSATTTKLIRLQQQQQQSKIFFSSQKERPSPSGTPFIVPIELVSDTM
jgi:hypothetical protein